MIRHTPFKPLLLPALIAGVLSASYSFNASADVYQVGFNDGFNAGQSSCRTNTVTEYKCEGTAYDAAFNAGKNSVTPTTNTVTNTEYKCEGTAYDAAFNAGKNSVTPTTNTVTNTVESCSGTAYTNAFNDGKTSVAACTDGQTSSCLLTSSQKAVPSTAEILAAGKIQVDANRTYEKGVEAAAANFTGTKLTLPALRGDLIFGPWAGATASAAVLDLQSGLRNDKDSYPFSFSLSYYSTDGIGMISDGLKPTSVPIVPINLNFIPINGTSIPLINSFSIGTIETTVTNTVSLTSICSTYPCDLRTSLENFAVAAKLVQTTSAATALVSSMSQITLKKPTGSTSATWYGDCGDTSQGVCTIDMKKSNQTVVLAFDKTSDPVPLKVTAGDTTLSAAGTTVTATTLLNATNTTTLCSLATNSVSYSLFVDGKCDSTATTTTVTNKDNKTISVVVPAPAVAATNSVTSSSLMVGTSATVLKDQSTSTLSLENTSTSIFVEAKLSCSTGNCNLSNPNTVSFVATQLVGSTLTSLTPATADCKDSICRTNLVATNSSSTVIVSATFNGQSVGKQQFISIK